MDELTVFKEAIQLSQKMLDAVSSEDFSSLAELAEKRELLLKEIHSLLENKQTITEESAATLKVLIQTNDEVAGVVESKRDDTLTQIGSIKAGKLARQAYKDDPS